MALAFRVGEIPSDKGENQQRPLEEVGATAGLALEGQIGIPSCLEVEGRVSQAMGSAAKPGGGNWRASGCGQGGRQVESSGARLPGWLGMLWGVLDC